jgi:hypothetical protein
MPADLWVRAGIGQGPPFNAAIADTKALRGTFVWGSAFFVVLALDLIPGLIDAVSLVSAPCAFLTPSILLHMPDAVTMRMPP